jgi:ribosomal protein S18 acetylase RimI-like enzyme
MQTPQQVKSEERGFAAAVAGAVPAPPAVRPLDEARREEVLAFLSAGTVDNIYMSGLVRDNGIESDANRGTFYGAFARDGALEGVALIGHFTLVEARTERALAAFAALAQAHPSAHMIVGSPEKIDGFWRHYGAGGQQPRLFCRELFFERRDAPGADGEDDCEIGGAGRPAARALRPATAEDLDLIAPVQASMIYDESGVNPLARDAAGFRARLARRVAAGRVWVLVEAGRLVFKVDVMAETPEAAYLEGLYVHPDERGRGCGRRCLDALSRTLLGRSRAVCLVVNEQNKAAQSFFFKAGFKLRGLYDSIYLAPKTSADA